MANNPETPNQDFLEQLLEMQTYAAAAAAAAAAASGDPNLVGTDVNLSGGAPMMLQLNSGPTGFHGPTGFPLGLSLDQTGKHGSGSGSGSGSGFLKPDDGGGGSSKRFRDDHHFVDVSNNSAPKNVFQGQTMSNPVPVAPHQPAVRPRVRARRGQATDPHSIAERLRRERIAERIRALQELVPSVNKCINVSYSQELPAELRDTNTASLPVQDLVESAPEHQHEEEAPGLSKECSEIPNTTSAECSAFYEGETGQTKEAIVEKQTTSTGTVILNVSEETTNSDPDEVFSQDPEPQVEPLVCTKREEGRHNGFEEHKMKLRGCNMNLNGDNGYRDRHEKKSLCCTRVDGQGQATTEENTIVIEDDDLMIVNGIEDGDCVHNSFDDIIRDFEARISELQRVVSTMKATRNNSRRIDM